MSAVERVRELVEPLLVSQETEVFDVVLHGSTLQVIVDREGGVDLEAVARATEAVSHALDSNEVVPGPYVLEVTSPGLERPLRTPAHFRRAVGSTVTVKTCPGVEGERRIDGVLDAADDVGIVVDGRSLAYADVERARTTFDWGPSPKPGGSKKKKKKVARS